MPELLPRWRWTAAQVRDLIDESRPAPRYELIDGELLVTPSPGYPHQFAVLAIANALTEYVIRENIGTAMISPADIELVPENVTQPDVFVHPPVSPADPERGVTWTDVKKLLLAIEIISPSSVRNDRIIKRNFYLKAGVPEYWVVDLDARIIERWIPSSPTPTIDRASLAWQPREASSPLVIDLPVLFERIWTDYRRFRPSR